MEHLVHEINRTLASQQADLDKKIYKEDLKTVETLIEALPTVPDILDWKQKLNDDNAEFEKEHLWFRSEFKKQNEMIARYDEVLNERASKHTVREIEKALGDKLTAAKVQIKVVNDVLKKTIDIND